jgi:syntaxin-binding protein 1
LRSYAKRRVLVDMIDNVRRHALFDKDYLVMVVDNAALKVFSSCCQMYELISISKVYHVEKLNKNRKKFRKTDAIYFVSPCEESI